MEELTGLRIEEFLERIGDRQPTPGGGSVAGAAGAFACALGRMVVVYSIGAKTKTNVRERLETSLLHLHRLEQIMSALITQDAVAYETMTDLSKKLPASGDSAGQSDAYQQAVLSAVAVPMEIAAVASRALTALDDLKTVANRYLLSDLGIAAVLADATARSAWFLVRVNLGELADDSRREVILTEISETLRHCETRRESIEAFVRDRLENPAPPSR